MAPPIEQLLVDLCGALRDHNYALRYIIAQLRHDVFTGEARAEADVYLHELGISMATINNVAAFANAMMTAETS